MLPRGSMLLTLIAVLAAAPVDAAPLEQSVEAKFVQTEERLLHRKVPIEVGAGVATGGHALAGYVGPSLRVVGTLPFGMTIGLDGSVAYMLFFTTGELNLSLGYAFTPSDWIVRPYLSGGAGFYDAIGPQSEATLVRTAMGFEVLTPNRIFGFGAELGVSKVLERPYAEEPTGVAGRALLTWYFL